MSLLHLATALAFVFAGPLASSQTTEPIPEKIQDHLHVAIHGYATQSAIYSNRNDWSTTDSPSGSLAWTEAVVNLTAKPRPGLRLGAQGRYFHLGNYGQQFLLDWALAEYKIDEHLGFRAGKIKTPAGLLSEAQDIDPAHLWILLPQSVYPIASRTSTLSESGGLLFGSANLGEKFGQLDYRVHGGKRVIPSGDRYLEPLNGFGLSAPDGLKGSAYGLQLRWRTPLTGLMLGASYAIDNPGGKLQLGPFVGKIAIRPILSSCLFAQYERGKLMVAGEYNRVPRNASLIFPQMPVIGSLADQRNFYLMSSYKLASRVTTGVYYSSALDRQAAFTSARYQKDWNLAVRYDFSSFLYLKAEQHFLDGTLIGYSPADQAHGLAETSHLSLLKLGVSF